MNNATTYSVDAYHQRISLNRQSLQADLELQADKHGLRYALLHTDSGVVWGKVDADRARKLHLVWSIEPSWTALQQGRLFGQNAELLFWPSNGTVQASLVTDVKPQAGDLFSTECYDEDYLMWGDSLASAKAIHESFTRLHEGGQGLEYDLPLMLATEAQVQALRLHVRHYLVTDMMNGFTQVGFSRLVDFHTSNE